VDVIDLSTAVLEKTFPPHYSTLNFGLENIDTLFLGFRSGDFGVFHGSPACLALSLLLSVRCQLPSERGGLDSSVVFVDGGNTFDLYEVSRIAQQYGLDPKAVLDRIFISRAFTAYQLTSLIVNRLKSTVDKFAAKLVVLSDVARLYNDRDVPKKEAMDVFNKLTLFLSKFALDNEVIVIATNFTQKPSARNVFMDSALLGRANVVIGVKDSHRVLRFAVEKHSVYKLGTVEFPSVGITLQEFMEA
jgi:hypothetical protein